jgi:TonB family protein
MIAMLLVLAAQAATPAAGPQAPSPGTAPSMPAPSTVPGTPQPAESPAAWFGADDYPVAALKAHEQGRVGVAVDVDAGGAPIKCTVASSSGSINLDDGTCAIVMQRARFRPARDAAGTAIPGQFRTAVHWAIPRGAENAVMVSFSGTANKRICSFEQAGKVRRLGPELCQGLAKAIVAKGDSLDKPVSVTIPDIPGAVLPEGK